MQFVFSMYQFLSLDVYLCISGILLIYYSLDSLWFWYYILLHVFLFFCFFSYFSFLCLVFSILFFFFFKQKTAYEMRISDWSSDVCSSDLMSANARAPRCQPKKSQLHKAFTASCTKNRVSAARAARNPPTRQTSHAAMPISAYKTVQTGPKISGDRKSVV